MKKKDIISLIVLVLILSAAAWKWVTTTYTDKQTAILLDTVVTINATSKDKEVNTTISHAFDLMRSYDKQLSYTNPESEVWKLNNSPEDSLTISPDVYRMLVVGQELFTRSDSLYDLTVGPLSDVWHFIGIGDSTKEMTVPPADSIIAARDKVGFQRITFGPNWIKRPVGMRLNFGSIAKGYIVDRTVEYLQHHGVTSGWVQAGGDIRYFGKMRVQRTGIQHPRGNSGDVIAVLRLHDITVDTSGDYERFFMVGNKRYHHILNPRTGFPSDASVSVTVVAPHALLADALSTAIFVLGPEKGIELAAKYPGVEAIIYTEGDGKLIPHMTPGMGQYLEL
jgi:thiamine biosynthesis lipoprotein